MRGGEKRCRGTNLHPLDQNFPDDLRLVIAGDDLELPCAALVAVSSTECTTCRYTHSLRHDRISVGHYKTSPATDHIAGRRQETRLSDEASKTRSLWGELENSIVSGKGIDIGCGADPVRPDVRRFDLEHGDANQITRHLDETFDFVFSCHSLEHMRDPELALKEWWHLVREGGHMVVVVPDEDLYEQGYFPSLFNEDHKATFTVSKQKSWSPRSYNVLELSELLDGARLISLRVQDQNYSRRLQHHSCYSLAVARRGRWFTRKLGKLLGWTGLTQNRLCHWLRLPVDQTGGEAVAQIQFILKKVL